MSDAVKQSVERCKYRHDWQEQFGQHPIPAKYYVCGKCGHRPAESSKLWLEAEAIVTLRKVLKPGDTVYTILRHVSRSGMTRGIDCYIIQDNKPDWITGYVGRAIGSPQSEEYWRKSLGLKVGGCGMDMGFHVVYSLSRVLFPEGFTHRDIAKPEGERRDGGYALKHAWL